MTSKKIQVVYADRQGIYEVNADQVLRKKDGNMIIIDWRTVKPENAMYILPHIHSYDESTDTITSMWGSYIEKDYPRLFPKFEIAESAPGYLVVRRYDGQLFKIVDNFVGEILENIYVNAGKTFWDIVVVECMIEAKENPRFGEDEDYRESFADKVAMVIGFLAYVCDLVELRF